MAIRNPIVFLCMTVMAFAAVLGGCDASAEDVRATDVALFAAFDGRDGAKAASLLSKDSIKRLDRIVELARTAKKADVKSLPYADRLKVLQARLLFEPKELKTTDGIGLMTKLVDGGWQGSTSDSTRERISVNDSKTRATITYRWPRSDRTFQGVWIFEDNGWKADSISQAEILTDRANEDARRLGITEDEHLFRTLKQQSGEDEIPSTIWDPSR